MTSAFMQQFPGEATVHPPQQFYAGDDWQIAVTCTDGDGEPMDLTSASLTWVLNNLDGTNILDLSIGDGIALVENVSGDLIVGEAFVTVASSRTLGLAPGFYRDELSVIAGDGLKGTQFRGRIEVLAKLPQAVVSG